MYVCAKVKEILVCYNMVRGVKLDDGRVVNEKLIDELINDELNRIKKRFEAWKKRTGDKSLDHVSFENAAKIFKEMITKENFDDFLTLTLYEKV